MKQEYVGQQPWQEAHLVIPNQKLSPERRGTAGKSWGKRDVADQQGIAERISRLWGPLFGKYLIA